MTINLNTLSESILRETQDFRYAREIEEHSQEIVRELNDHGFYENPKSGLRITMSSCS